MSGDVFKNKIRLRINGILRSDDALLMVKLKSPVTGDLIWMPPGGALHFGEFMKVGLKREFYEETGLRIKVGDFAFVNELVQPPFHAVECYFWVQKTGGELRLGTDPELSNEDQLLKDLKWIPVSKMDEYKIVPEALLRLVRNDRNSARYPFFSSDFNND